MSKIIFICHPWAGDLKPNQYNPHPELTRQICRHISLHTDDIPMSTGRYFNDFLHDDVESERARGIKLGHSIMKICDVVYVYRQYGISKGMKQDIEIATSLKKEIVYKDNYPWEE